jgi:hypothetical protein
MRTARILTLTALLAAIACNKSEEAESGSEKKAERDDGGIAKVAAVDPKLAEAFAASSAKPAGAGAAEEGGPPANGIFAPGAADKEMPKGGAPKITLGSEGSMPKVALRALPKPGSKMSGTIQIALQSNPQQGALPILFSLTLEAKKPAAAAAASDTAPVAQPVPITARVTAAKIDAPGAPRELDQLIGKLKGSKVDYEVLPDGAGTGYRFEVPPGVQEAEIRDAVRALSDTLALLTIPYPDKPLGEGGYWMVTSRGELFGLDLVTYRLIKVEKVTAEAVVLKVNTKRYAADTRFELPGLPPNIPPTIVEFQANSDGTLQLTPGAFIAQSGQIESVLAAALGSAAAKQRGVFQQQSRAQIALK